MALQKLNEVAVTLSAPVLVAQVTRKTKRDGQVVTEVNDENGVPRWVIDGLVPVEAGVMATISVTVTAAEKPNPGVSCRFTNLIARPYGIAQGSGRVNTGLYFVADSVEGVK